MASAETYDVVVVGCGIAGLSAAVAAAEDGARVVVLERAPRDERGGNTRYTEAGLRLKSESEVSDDFETQFAANAGGYIDPEFMRAMAQAQEKWPRIVRALGVADPELIDVFASNVGATVGWLKGFGARFAPLAGYLLTTSTTRMMTIGGGLALVEALAEQAEKRKVTFRYETTAQELIREGLTVRGVRAIGSTGAVEEYRGAAVVLACGGFEGNPEMLTKYLGPQAQYMRPVARGGYYNKGEGIRMALGLGAAPAGEYGSYHAEPIDPRSGRSEPVIFTFPYGILVNRTGKRFIDESSGPVDATYEAVTREIFRQPRGIAYTIQDAKVQQIPNWQAAVRTDQPPLEAPTVTALAGMLAIPAAALEATVREYNDACRPGSFDAFKADGLATVGLTPPKSNHARPIDTPPFRAYPIISANCFTFGGVKVNVRAQVLHTNGDPIPGLYAAGEVIGLYYGTYTGATSVLRGAVFGRIAGRDAAARAVRARA